MSPISDVWITHDDSSYECGECHSIFSYPYEDCPSCGCKKSYVFMWSCCNEMPIDEYINFMKYCYGEEKYND